MLTAYAYDLATARLRPQLPMAAVSACLQDPGQVVWLDFLQPTAEDFAWLEAVFGFHPLCLEDCSHPQEISKLEEFPQYLFLVVHGPQTEQTAEALNLVELDVFIGHRFLVTVHHEPLQAVALTQESLERGATAIHLGAVSLAHEVLDRMVDLYMPVVEALDARLQGLEDTLQQDFGGTAMKVFSTLLRAILQVRRVALKEQEVFYWLSHREMTFISRREALLFKDIYDHLVRVAEISNASRETLAGILNIHLSLMSNRMNDIMRNLTIFAAIFLPLSFITSLYGMNFHNMPELANPNGYRITLGIMTLIVLLMLAYFRRKRWL